jgi:hypothetical protein
LDAGVTTALARPAHLAKSGALVLGHRHGIIQLHGLIGAQRSLAAIHGALQICKGNAQRQGRGGHAQDDHAGRLVPLAACRRRVAVDHHVVALLVA